MLSKIQDGRQELYKIENPKNIAILKNARPEAARHWRCREAAIEDIDRAQYSILLKCTKFEINRTNMRLDIAISNIVPPAYMYR